MGRGCLRALLSAAVLTTLYATQSWAAALSHLQVDYQDSPLGLDNPAPHFSWQMRVDDSVRGMGQSEYRLTVHDPSGNLVWDSGKTRDERSIDIAYAGPSLKPVTRYRWRVDSWDQEQRLLTADAWFETGIMNPDPTLSGWDGADWIGGSDADLVLYARYLSIFDLSYVLTIAPGSHRAAVVFAANDPRLMNPDKNIFQLKAARDRSYFKVELDVGTVSARGGALLKIYRSGYSNTDDPRQPVKIYAIAGGLINAGNAHDAHRVRIRDEFGQLKFTIDGQDHYLERSPSDEAASGAELESLNLNPAGAGGGVITYGQLCELGFSLDPHERATISELTVSNVRKPFSALFKESLLAQPYRGIYKGFNDNRQSGLRVTQGRYELAGGEHGLFAVSDPSQNAMPMLRTTFETSVKAIRTARLYVTARGIYEVYINGNRVGEDFYNPGLTQYNRTQLYQTFDVTNLLVSGKNAMGAMLGEGWWSGLLSYGDVWNHFGDRQSLLAKLVITYDDGSREVVGTSGQTWKYFNRGPVVYSSLYLGEVYDATREAAVHDWSTPAYDDGEWHPAARISLSHTADVSDDKDALSSGDGLHFEHLQLIGQIGEPAQVFETLTARSVKEVRGGVYLYDMGQNIVGVPRLRFEDGQAGRRVTVRVSEMLYPGGSGSGGNAGMIMTENYRAALSEDQYVMRAGKQTFEPRFTSHGYQFIEISGLDAPLAAAQVQALVISSVRAITASYESSNPKVNKLWSNILWSNVDNFLSVPTDCPQRNERMGWSGDISVFSRTATYLSNADPFLQRHLRALRDTQQPSGRFADIAPVGGGFGGVLWGSAGITIPWELYQQYADVGALQEHYPAMVHYIEYLATTIDPNTGLSSDAILGDWLGPQNKQLGQAFLATAYHILDLDIVARVAVVLGRQDDAARFRKMYSDRKAFFNKTFVNPDHQTLGRVGGQLVFRGAPYPYEVGDLQYKVADTQSSYAIGLALRAFNESTVDEMAKNLAATVARENTDDRGVVLPKYSLMTGFIGTAWISKALSDSNHEDLAYRLLQNEAYPSWLYAIDQGATTIWERLNGYTAENGFGGNNGMNSFNHYSFGAVGQWLMAYSLGIQRDEPGFKHFVLQPEPDPTRQMSFARGHYDSPYGRIESAWSTEGKSFSYSATVPANTTATLYLPTRSVNEVRESGKPVGDARGITFERYANGKAVYQLGSGHYDFSAP
jgi:alpha-L-rhamnosidase